MKHKLLEHIYSIVFVGVTLTVGVYILNFTGHRKPVSADPLVRQLSDIQALRPDHPLHRALIRESAKSFFPDRHINGDSLVDALIDYRRQIVLTEIEASRRNAEISLKNVTDIVPMFGSFIAAFVVVMGFIYYGAQTLGLFQFMSDKQGGPSRRSELIAATKLLFSKINSTERKSVIKKIITLQSRFAGKTLFYAIAFSPAYVVAYSFKTNFETDSMLFLVLLGIGTNGVLITLAHKFYSLLHIESRKGYVETAIAKGLNADYRAIQNRRIWMLRKYFPNHVLRHIFIHTRHQYLATIKEQGSMVITGLIIIEMALNIQGHLGYELLKNILYRNWEAAGVMVFCIFLLIKTAEAAVDFWIEFENRKYENRDAR